MVGDNPVADVQGARAAGLDAVLVHHAGGVTDLRQDAARIRRGG
jgi:ribonucleotide monophosphatase NagD (HAD superfamily)